MSKLMLPLASLLALFCPLLSAQDAPMKCAPQEDLDMKVYPLDSSAAAVVLCGIWK